MVQMGANLWLGLLAWTLSSCLAERDDNYFANGGRNPNTKKKMYWRDARNVLQDLSMFQSLSVRYHSCAWSEMVPDNDGESHDNNNDNGGGAFCNTIDYGEGDDENNAYDWWYLGKTSCNRANVAFSLYGTLVGDSEGGCRKSTYINSFFTSAGITPFLASLQEAGVSYFQSDDVVNNINSQCSITNGDVYNDDLVSYRDDDSFEYFSYGTHNQEFFSDTYSRSLYCNKRGKFVVQSFHGPFCEGSKNIRATDSLSRLNSELNGASCVQIYNAGSGDNEDNEGDHNDNDEYDGALSLLEYSKACSLRDPSGACPDPHGKLRAYTRALERTTKGFDDTVKRRKFRQAFSVVLLIASFAMILVAGRILVRRCMRRFPALRKRFGKRRLAKELRRRRHKKSKEPKGDGLVNIIPPPSSQRSVAKSKKSKKKKRRNSKKAAEVEPVISTQESSPRSRSQMVEGDRYEMDEERNQALNTSMQSTLTDEGKSIPPDPSPVLQESSSDSQYRAQGGGRGAEYDPLDKEAQGRFGWGA